MAAENSLANKPSKKTISEEIKGTYYSSKSK
jgi:hypothetical protein